MVSLGTFKIPLSKLQVSKGTLTLVSIDGYKFQDSSLLEMTVPLSVEFVGQVCNSALKAALPCVNGASGTCLSPGIQRVGLLAYDFKEPLGLSWAKRRSL